MYEYDDENLACNTLVKNGKNRHHIFQEYFLVARRWKNLSSRSGVCFMYKTSIRHTTLPLEGKVEAQQASPEAGGRISKSQGQRCRPRRPDALVAQGVLDTGPALHDAARAIGVRVVRSRCVGGGVLFRCLPYESVVR